MLMEKSVPLLLKDNNIISPGTPASLSALKIRVVKCPSTIIVNRFRVSLDDAILTTYAHCTWTYIVQVSKGTAVEARLD